MLKKCGHLCSSVFLLRKSLGRGPDINPECPSLTEHSQTSPLSLLMSWWWWNKWDGNHCNNSRKLKMSPSKHRPELRCCGSDSRKVFFVASITSQNCWRVRSLCFEEVSTFPIQVCLGEHSSKPYLCFIFHTPHLGAHRNLCPNQEWNQTKMHLFTQPFHLAQFLYYWSCEFFQTVNSFLNNLKLLWVFF